MLTDSAMARRPLDDHVQLRADKGPERGDRPVAVVEVEAETSEVAMEEAMSSEVVHEPSGLTGRAEQVGSPSLPTASGSMQTELVTVHTAEGSEAFGHSSESGSARATTTTRSSSARVTEEPMELQEVAPRIRTS